MLPYPNIDPVAVSLGPLKIHWYGLMYVVGIGAAWWLARRRARRGEVGLTAAQVDDLIFYAALGVILGGRLGYTFFYNFSGFLDNPWMILRIWEGGMSFHGGMLGVFFAMWWFGRRENIGFFTLSDFIAPLVPIGLGAGRIGNFINGELWGKMSDVPWAMVFPGAGIEPRHPSMLYEALLEGLVLFVLLQWFIEKPRPRMATSGLFLLLYGIFRFAVEFVRLPDAQIGYLAFGWLTMGQVLTLPMILFGIGLLVMAYRRLEAPA
ncbi:MAG TPA: prolipoprotein diacylglyceryl transferase [Methylococcaceae bacterium]|jgi:phosphatidylglycerol:prolipoprotein diacylglycerol transferase|nr:prolipoprotein diacylglyceryl transferase [Methylococcaceae bacterium]